MRLYCSCQSFITAVQVLGEEDNAACCHIRLLREVFKVQKDPSEWNAGDFKDHINIKKLQAGVLCSRAKVVSVPAINCEKFSVVAGEEVEFVTLFIVSYAPFTPKHVLHKTSFI